MPNRRTVLIDLPPQILDATLELEKTHGVKVPFPVPGPPQGCPYKVSFLRPAQFNVVGSYVSKTMVRSRTDHVVDMVLVIPSDILQEKDYLNLRYFYKRAYYLARIAASLQERLGSHVELFYDYLNDNPLVPVLSIKPRRITPETSAVHGTKEKGEGLAGSVPGYCIRLMPCAPTGFFPQQKLTATAASIRNDNSDKEGSKLGPSPTPFYNSTVKSESTFFSYLRLLRQTEKACISFRDASILGRIWLQQRGFGSSISEGGFGHFEWAALMAILQQTGGRKGQALLSASLNSTQLFKAMIQYLAETDILQTPCILGQSREPTGSISEAGPVIYDSARNLNIVFKMSPWSAALLRRFAKWTHALLTDSSSDHFRPTFISKADHPAHLFDLCVKVEFSPGPSESVFSLRGRNWALDTKLFATLKKALGRRAQLIHSADLYTISPWTICEHPPSKSPGVLVGVLFDAVHMSRQVDYGPPAENKEEAAKFRRFWGEKAELRRFKDGSILETLIWDSASSFELCEEIVRYVVGRHLGDEVALKQLKFYGNGLSPLVPLKPTDGPAFSVSRQAFEVFERDIRGLDDLPLHIRQLVPICPELRLSSTVPPTLGSAKAGPTPMDVVIFFEASGKWPDNLAAIQRAKVAFLLKIGRLLEEAKADQITTHIRLVDAHHDSENFACLDVLYPSGVAFRLQIQSDLEESLLDSQTRDKTLDHHTRTESATLLSNFRRSYNCLPLHTQAIRTHATRFPALSPTIRLLKSWFDSHKLSIHFSPDLIELFALHTFLTPYPWDTPSSPSTGFLRTLLFLARWDWRSEPLVVDTASSLGTHQEDMLDAGGSNPVDRSVVATRLEAWRKIDPVMDRTVLFVATNHDASGTAHTSIGGEPYPCKVVATRMTTLARSAYRVTRDANPSLDDESARALFVPSLGDYDFLARLNRKVLRQCSRIYAVDVVAADDRTDDGDEAGGEKEVILRPRFKNLDLHTGQIPLPAGTHPARILVLQLQKVYGDTVVFFHGAEDDTVIGAIWNPRVQRRSFRANLPRSYRPASGGWPGETGGNSDDGDDDDDDDDVVEVNREGLLAEVARIGGDLVDRIEVKERY